MEAMEPSKGDGGAFASGGGAVGSISGGGAVGGLGNYKGVMLCNRPSDDGPGSGFGGGAANLGGDGQAPPFKPTIAFTANEQLGLPPCKKQEQGAVVKTRGPSAALRRHCQWIKELQSQVREEQQRTDDVSVQDERRKTKMAQVFKEQRDKIRELKKQKDDLDPEMLKALLNPKASQKQAAAQKPAWARTEEQNADYDEEEAEELLRFADGLNFDQYIEDLEFRECLQVVRDRTKKLQKEQDLFKDDLLKQFNEDGEEQSCGSGSPRGSALGELPKGMGRERYGGSQPEWDSSTAAGDEQAEAVRDGRSAAERALEANPQLKAVHSKASAARLIEKARSEACSEYSVPC